MADICDAYYDRPLDGAVQHVRCTYILGHGAGHSWQTLKAQDEADEEARKAAAQTRAQPTTTLPTDNEVQRLIALLLNGLFAGRFDPYLEAILSVTHERKRVLRGARTFDGVQDLLRSMEPRGGGESR